MARKSSSSKARHESNRTVTIKTPSPYGSHRVMVVKELDDGKVICEDGYGQYETTVDRLDTGLADPCRYSGRNIVYEMAKEKTPTP